MPQDNVQVVPVRVLNVKLGGKANAAAITSSDVKRLFSKRRLAETQPAVASAPAPAKSVIEKRPEPEPVKPEPIKKVEPKLELAKKVEAKPVPKKVEAAKQEVARAALETPKPKAAITPPPPPPKSAPVKVVKKKTPPKPEPLPKVAVKKPEPKMERQVIRQPLKTARTAEAKKPKRYVRANQLTAKLGSKKPKELDQNGGSVIGNSGSKKAEIQKRYTQTISLWIDKHKVYPDAARSKGEGGKVVLRIRINRQGRVLRYLLEKSSGSEAIDRAITQMIDAANPLPSVPGDYPDNKPYLEFLIPINFIP
ncbi:MAG: TonB family protein [Rickettsiales bacterium]|nr:TonB family protein [Rickettsiales bacterium]